MERLYLTSFFHYKVGKVKLSKYLINDAQIDGLVQDCSNSGALAVLPKAIDLMSHQMSNGVF